MDTAFARFESARLLSLEDLFSTCSADQLTDWWLLWRSGIACVVHIRRQHKWWTACKHRFMTRNAILFVSRLVRKFFQARIPRHIRRRLLITNVLFCWFISTVLLHNACECFGRFLRHPFLVSRLQVRPLDWFSRAMAQKTRSHAGVCL